MELKPGYKQTEVGVIPEDWAVSQVGRTCTQVTTGKLDANAMEENGAYRFYTCAKNFYRIDSYAFDCEALLISGNGAHVGYVHYYNGKFNAYQRTYVLSGFKSAIKFVQHYLEKNFRDRIQVEVRAGGTPYITRGTITESPIPLPPTITEQESIATALSEVDALMEGLDRLIAKKRDLKQAAMQQLLTGDKRLPGFEGEWKVLRFSDHFQIYAGGDVPKDSLSQTQSEDHPYPIYANAIQKKGLYGFTNVKRGKPNSVTITARGYLGHAEYREEPFFPIVRLLVLEPTGSLDAKYTTYAINDRVEFSIESTGVPQLTAPQVGKYAVAAPPTLIEQRAIATILSDIDAEIAALEQRRAKTADLKQAMMQELLTGKTRLVEPQASDEQAEAIKQSDALLGSEITGGSHA